MASTTAPENAPVPWTCRSSFIPARFSVIARSRVSVLVMTVSDWPDHAEVARSKVATTDPLSETTVNVEPVGTATVPPAGVVSFRIVSDQVSPPAAAKMVQLYQNWEPTADSVGGPRPASDRW